MSASWHPEVVLEPRFRWTFPETLLIDPEMASAAVGRGIGDRMTGLLARRGVTDAAGLDAWFAEPLDGLHDPRLLPDADRLLARPAHPPRRVLTARHARRARGAFAVKRPVAC